MSSRADVFAKSDIIVQVRTLGANPDIGRSDLSLLRAGQLVIGFGEALTAPEACAALATSK